MPSPSIKVVLPLADAHTNRRTGGKAICLSKLIAARFAVPKGFVLSADAYRSHLWISGAREIALARAEAEEREAIRAAILAQPIPEDVWQSVADAYERLSWQIGVAEPKVAVRSSALEDNWGGSGFPGAYESYLNVSGLENLDAAVKRVWASLWSGKAAAYRARYGSPTEPAMAVIVQQMVEAELTGTAFTANPVTGDPHGVSVTVRRSEGQSGQYTVSLDDFEVDGREHVAAVKNIAEQSVLIEDAIGGRVEVQWALDRDGLWILQAGPITDLPGYFPADLAGESVWARDNARPICHLGRGLIGHDLQVRTVNGYLYSQRQKQLESVVGREIAGLMKESEKHLPALRERVSHVVNADPASLDPAALSAALKSAAEDARASYSWMRKAERLSDACVNALAEVVEDTALIRRLLGGVRDVIFERDALLQELSERFAIAEKSGKLEDEKWWRGYKSDVEQFERQYGYAFKDAGEAADASRWRSWVEDPDSVFRMIGAISKRGSKPTLVTLHSAAEQDSAEAEAEALAQLAGGKQSHLKRLLESARGLLSVRSEMEQNCALAGTALRRRLVDYAGRLERAGMIYCCGDVFCLEIDELLSIPAQAAYSARTEFAAKIARRKHEEWLEQRLTPPETLPLDDGAPRPHESKLSGLAASAGVVSGRARIVSTIEEAAEIENGDILITASASAAWTPFVAIAGGLICESGSEFSPAAIAARTYGIPAVVGCKGALGSIKDGQRITVDGANGSVIG